MNATKPNGWSLSTAVQVMDRCRPNFTMSYGITRQQCVKNNDNSVINICANLNVLHCITELHNVYAQRCVHLRRCFVIAHKSSTGSTRSYDLHVLLFGLQIHICAIRVLRVVINQLIRFVRIILWSTTTLCQKNHWGSWEIKPPASWRRAHSRW